MEDAAILKAAAVRLIFSDVDGVWTDGSLFYSESGVEHMKAFHVRDGLGVKLAQAAGIEVVLLSSKPSSVLQRRAAELGITDCFDGITDKVSTARRVASDRHVTLSQCAMIGDDLVDLPLMRAVGFAVTVMDAPDYLREAADMVTSSCGGRGAFREVVEWILKAKGVWSDIMSRFGGLP